MPAPKKKDKRKPKTEAIEHHIQYLRRLNRQIAKLVREHGEQADRLCELTGLDVNATRKKARMEPTRVG